MSVDSAVSVLRVPTAADRSRVAEIVEATGVFRPEEEAVALEVFDDAIARPGQDYFSLAVFDEDRLVGFTLYGPTPCTEATWDLYWIVVDPTTQRHGIGRRLMTGTEERIRERLGRLVVVETSSRADYGATRAFYDALGYGRAARIPNYYASDDDLIVYTRTLTPPSTDQGHHG